MIDEAQPTLPVSIVAPLYRYQTNNSELMAVLLDRETFPTGQPTVNAGHMKNPQKNPFLSAQTSVSDQISAGIGSDLVYRDPWGDPYIISLDVNGDGVTHDAVYRKTAVSRDVSQASQTMGFNGLVGSATAQNSYAYTGPVMVWSAGPDKKFNSQRTANIGANKDNVLSWKP
jgi:hypothetical protein